MYPQSNIRGSSDWWAACKVRRKLFVAESFNDEQIDLNELVASDYYQDDGSFGTMLSFKMKKFLYLMQINPPTDFKHSLWKSSMVSDSSYSPLVSNTLNTIVPYGL
ncbi:hypothetical protein QL285_003722 [Trifolium repens]|nr:hypothetical protein QL285_003722 [Trifolium repens]